jgi:peptidoglycan/LPS O-acetylase OafA/YrhL
MLQFDRIQLWVAHPIRLRRGVSRIFEAAHSALSFEDNLKPHMSYVLDIARSVAAIAVVLFHAKIYALGNSSLTTLDTILYAITSCGSQAVFWFFAISGYLVGGTIIRDIIQTGQIDFRRYFINRLSRLYIVLLPALGLGAVLDYVRNRTWGLNYHAGYETAASLTGKTLLGNILFLQNLVVPTFGSNLALWSLADEFWYYILFPLLLAPLMIRKSGASRAMLFTLGTLLLLFLSVLSISVVWLFSLWCLGAAARFAPGAVIKSGWISWGIALGVVFAYPYLYPRLGALATLLVGVSFAGALLTTHGISAAPSSRRMALVKALAGFSFSLYLIHLPILAVIASVLSQSADPFLNLPPLSIRAPAMILLFFASSYAAAYVFSLLTEARTAALRDWLSDHIPQVKLRGPTAADPRSPEQGAAPSAATTSSRVLSNTPSAP